jgi:hypothetical protein
MNKLTHLIYEPENKYKNISKGLCKYIFFILLHLYKSNQEDTNLVQEYLFIIDNNSYFNSFETYETSQRNKIVSGDEMIKICEELKNKHTEPGYQVGNPILEQVTGASLSDILPEPEIKPDKLPIIKVTKSQRKKKLIQD